MSGRPTYPWSEGDALFADELNAAIEDAASGVAAGGPFLPLTGGTLGNGAGTPQLAFLGAPGGTGKGLWWQTPGVTRWQLVTNASEDLGLYAYDIGGAFVQTAWVARQATRTVDFSFKVNTITSEVSSVNGVAGNTFSAENIGINSASGHRFNYIGGGGDGGHDTGISIIARSNTAFSGSTVAVFQAMWIECETQIDTTHNSTTFIAEMNLVNRGVDAGFKRDTAQAGNNTGGLLFVPEKNVASGTGGEGKNVGFGYAVGHSIEANSTGFPVKTYIGFNVQPNASVGLTGRAFYASGDITGVSSQYPYGPFQTEGTWLHGFDHTKAVYTDTNATTMLAGQGVAWLTGTTGTPTNICRDTAGNGSPEGVVTANKGSTYRRFDGGAASCFYVKESGTGNTGWVAK